MDGADDNVGVGAAGDQSINEVHLPRRAPTVLGEFVSMSPTGLWSCDTARVIKRIDWIEHIASAFPESGAARLPNVQYNNLAVPRLLDQGEREDGRRRMGGPHLRCDCVAEICVNHTGAR
jgi:hypothetical protein